MGPNLPKLTPSPATAARSGEDEALLKLAPIPRPLAPVFHPRIPRNKSPFSRKIRSAVAASGSVLDTPRS